jgi:imidazolonepropionase-like amidohydrolase
MTTRIALCAVTFLFAASAHAQQHDRPVPLSSDTVAFVKVNVIPMDREHLLWRRTVITASGKIIALGSVDSIAIPPGAKRIDGDNKLFLLPGLADMHVHLRYPSDLLLLLANGVTRVRNMRGAPFHLEWRRNVAAGTMLGPRIMTAGPVLWGNQNARTAAEARAEVDSEAAAGYDFIKVYDFLSKPAYDAIVDEAAAKHIRVAGHVPSAVGVEGVLRAHQASIEHAEQYIYNYMGDDLDDARIPVIARATAAAHAYVTPTMSIIPNYIMMADAHDSVLTLPEIRYTDPETYAWWRTDVKASSAMNRMIESFQRKLVRGFRDAGVRMMAGTDFYLFGSVPGFGLHKELQEMQRAGLTPFEVLSTATRIPAEFAGDSAILGTVAVGKDADLLVLDANPLDDVANATHRVGVMLRGRWLPAAELQKMLDTLASRFAPEQRLVDAFMSRGRAGVASARAGARVDSTTFQESTMSMVGSWLARRKRLEDALAVRQLVTDAYPRSADARVELGDSYAAIGDTTKAAEAYRAALAIEPGRRDATEKLGKIGH